MTTNLQRKWGYTKPEPDLQLKQFADILPQT